MKIKLENEELSSLLEQAKIRISKEEQEELHERLEGMLSRLSQVKEEAEKEQGFLEKKEEDVKENPSFWRKDEEKESLLRNELLKNAPSAKNGYYYIEKKSEKTRK